MEKYPTSSRRSGRPYVVAMFLGTALLAQATAAQAQELPRTQAVTDISRYCTACWRNARLPIDTWNDCTQEVLCRLLQTIPAQAWDRALHAEGEERREFVRAIDAVKKRTQRTKKWTPHGLDTVADDDRTQAVSDERAVVEEVGRDLLSERQQHILRLSFEGWSVQEIAEEMSIPAERISDEKYKAIRKLRTHLTKEA